MKYDTIKNPNYVATVVRVPALAPLEGLDNLVALNMFGMQALVSKDTEVGSIGVLFSTEVQLSDEFAKNNNLHRHTNLNMDPTKAGYLEDSRRVKAIKLRGHRSDSLFMGLDAFFYLKGVKPEDFQVGDTFDSIDGHEILRKYVIKEPTLNNGPAARIRRVDLKVFPEHIDSENWWRNEHKIPADAPVVITQKLHGTSVRYGTVPVLRDKPWYEKALNNLGVVTSNHEYKFVVGSRKVVKSIDGEAESAGKDHFYASDFWSEYAAAHNLSDLIPDGYLVYGELVGYTPDGAPVQKGYTYEQVNPLTRMVDSKTWHNDPASTTPTEQSTHANSAALATSETFESGTLSTTKSGRPTVERLKNAAETRDTSDLVTSTTTNSEHGSPVTNATSDSETSTESVQTSSIGSPSGVQSVEKKNESSWLTTITSPVRFVASSVTRAIAESGSSKTVRKSSQRQQSTSDSHLDWPKDCAELYVYRIATVTPTGVVTDLSWPATKAFAHGIGLKTVPEMVTTLHTFFKRGMDESPDMFIDTNFYNDWSDAGNDMGTWKDDAPVRLSDAKMVDEGVCVRYDGPNGIYILKAKSPIFLGFESKMLDEGAEDLESEG